MPTTALPPGRSTRNSSRFVALGCAARGHHRVGEVVGQADMRPVAACHVDPRAVQARLIRRLTRRLAIRLGRDLNVEHQLARLRQSDGQVAASISPEYANALLHLDLGSHILAVRPFVARVAGAAARTANRRNHAPIRPVALNVCIFALLRWDREAVPRSEK